MAEKIAVLSVRIVEIMFFTGLVGCVLTVAISWVSILKSIILEED